MEVAGSVAVNSHRFQGPPQMLPGSSASTNEVVCDSVFCEINVQVIFLDKVRKLLQAKSLRNCSPKMKPFPECTLTSGKEADYGNSVGASSQGGDDVMSRESQCV